MALFSEFIRFDDLQKIFKDLSLVSVLFSLKVNDAQPSTRWN